MPGSLRQLFRDSFAFRRWDGCSDSFAILPAEERQCNRRIMHMILVWISSCPRLGYWREPFFGGETLVPVAAEASEWIRNGDPVDNLAR